MDLEQANSKEVNDDSERNKEIKKDSDDQKEKDDNQDSKDEVKKPDSKSILLPLFIVLGVVAMAMIYFLCKYVKKAKRVMKKLEKAFANKKHIEWTTIELMVLSYDMDPDFLEKLLKVSSTPTVIVRMFGKESSKVNIKLLFSKPYEDIVKTFFEKISERDEREIFESLLRVKCLSDLKSLLDFMLYVNKVNDDKIKFTPLVIEKLFCIVYEDENEEIKEGFTSCLLKDNVKFRNFALAILTGKYKGCQKSFKVNIKDFEYTFGSSPVKNLSTLFSKYKKFCGNKIGPESLFLQDVARKYNEWNPKQQ